MGFLGWDGGVSVDQSSEDSSHGLNTQGKWSNIEKKNIFNISSQDCTLNGSSYGDGFIWVHTLVWRFTEELRNAFLNLWHSSHTTNEQNLVDFVLGKTRVLEAGVEWLESSGNKISNNILKFSSGDTNLQMLWAGCVSRQVSKINFSLICG